MEVTVQVEPEKLWEFCKSHRERLGDEYVEVAWNDEYTVCVTDSGAPTDMYVVMVFEGSNESPVRKEFIVSDNDATSTLVDIYDAYLFGTGEIEDDEFDKAVEEATENIEYAIFEMISALTADDTTQATKLFLGPDFSMFVDEICTTVAAYDIDVYRPMRVYKDGEKTSRVSLYPYNEFNSVDSSTGIVY